MCGLAGVILGTKRRRRTEMAEIAARFTELLLLNERRGRHATGIALVDRDGGQDPGAAGPLSPSPGLLEAGS